MVPVYEIDEKNRRDEKEKEFTPDLKLLKVKPNLNMN